jgi:ABC-type transport system substrate-binding protein
LPLVSRSTFLPPTSRSPSPDATSLDPQEQLSGQTLEMSHLVFDPLMRYTQDLQFEPRLAEKYERIDDKTVRFTCARA